MKQFFRKTLSVLLAVSLLAVPAAASDALGEDLTGRDTLLNQETQLSTNVFWSTAFSDLRTENLITYTPNKDVTPIVTYGSVLTSTSTVSSMAKQLEKEGYRVVAGINGDFYNVTTGLPIGLVVTEGQLRSSDAGYYAVGFKADGSAVLGKPAIKVNADLGYGVDDGLGGQTEVVRRVAGINKARVSSGGIYLYTYDFNAKHTTGTTEAGVDVLCTIADGSLSVGGTLTLNVEQVLETSAATPIGEDQVVLSVNAKSDVYYVDALRNVPAGAEIVLDITAADEEWNDVEYAVGALYSLVQDGVVVSGLQTGVNPRTAVGQKADGTLVFYTIDGRKSGHSIGASMTQVAERLVELGCVTALCLDGGGSTTLSVTEPDDVEAKTINLPSEGSERAVSNQIFLVADSQPSGRLSHFYIKADSEYVLAGSKVNITASAVDTNYIPMDRHYDLWASSGQLDGNVLTTPADGGDITVTAEGGGKQGVTTVHAITAPDEVSIRNSSGAEVTTLNVTPGSATQLSASAAYSHMTLKADPECFTWTVEGGIGTLDEKGVFNASAPGSGTITVSAGGKSASVDVTVSRMPLETVEDFEAESTVFDAGTENAVFSRTKSESLVRLGRASGKIDYTLAEDADYALTSRVYASAPLNSVYTTMNFWVYGDGSGNTLSVIYDSITEGEVTQPAVMLDFTGWKQVTVELWSARKLLGFEINGGYPTVYMDDQGNVITAYPTAAQSGTVYIDQLVSAFAGTVDNTVPAISVSVEENQLTAVIQDTVDGVLPLYSVNAAYDGAALDFRYNASAGKLTADLPEADGAAHRITVTARDASGNIGRASYDVPAGEEWVPYFSDTRDYWGAAYVEYLYTAGVTGGYEDGTFRPNQNITRAQFAVMLYRYLKLDAAQYEDVVLPFADVEQIPGYAVSAVKALYTEGVINGSAGKDGKLYFNPGSSLTRAQAAAMIGRTQEKGYASVELSFTDAAKIPGYARTYIQTMAAQGVLGGYGDGTFRPGNHITRGQMAKILYNLM